MKQAEDRLTMELPGLVPAKRGRGRPRKDDALTPAQRAKRYRDRKGALARIAKLEAKIAALGCNFKPEPLPAAYYCKDCGETAVYSPKTICATCWPFPSHGKP